jgi:8-oxo-dGTP pyrophosphatase MutT (NUDIX family)
MGAGVLFICFINSKLHFLFGKERDIDENPGWSDFGGGSEPSESFIATACRECSEELCGFVGSKTTINTMLKTNGYINLFLPNPANKKKGYMVFITLMDYNPYLLEYFNNHQRFIHQHLDKKTIKDSKLFEKTQIKWFTFDEISKNKKIFRGFYKKIAQMLLDNRGEIENYAKTLISK